MRKLHLNPGMHYPRVFTELFDHPSDARLWAIGGSALAYAAMRFTEAYGLWRERARASWLGVWSGGIYIPLELYRAVVHPTLLHIGPALANAAVVLYGPGPAAPELNAGRARRLPCAACRTASAPHHRPSPPIHTNHRQSPPITADHRPQA